MWLLQQRETLRPRLEGDPEFYDAKIAGWWVWGIACWIGSGFCSGNGPWLVNDDRQLVHLGDNGRGVNRKLVHLGNNGQGDESEARPGEWFRLLSDRLKRVRVCSGDWSRVCGPSVTFKHGMTGVLLDPPYADTAERQSNLYREDSDVIAHAVRDWAVANGDNPLLRIALCGYNGEHNMPDSWSVYEWSAGDGFGGQAKERSNNHQRERIWFSPACAVLRQDSLFHERESCI